MSRLAIFIDGGYVDQVLRHEFAGAKISYDKLVSEIASTIYSDIDLLRSYYYHCEPYKSDPPTPDESQRFGRMQSFLNSLRRLESFEVRLGRLVRRNLGTQGEVRYEQKMVDILLSIDLVQLSSRGNITHAALVSGDSDFVPAVRIAREAGVSVWLFHGDRPHNELWQTADRRVHIGQDLINQVSRRTP